MKLKQRISAKFSDFILIDTEEDLNIGDVLTFSDVKKEVIKYKKEWVKQTCDFCGSDTSYENDGVEDGTKESYEMIQIIDNKNKPEYQVLRGYAGSPRLEHSEGADLK